MNLDAVFWPPVFKMCGWQADLCVSLDNGTEGPAARPCKTRDGGVTVLGLLVLGYSVLHRGTDCSCIAQGRDRASGSGTDCQSGGAVRHSPAGTTRVWFACHDPVYYRVCNDG